MEKDTITDETEQRSNTNDDDANTTNVDIEKNNNSSSSRGDALATGLYTTLSQVIRDFNSKAEDTLRSQISLSSSLDRLTKELDQLLEDAPFPFMIQHAARISAVTRRVSSLNLRLKSIQLRVDDIDRLVSAVIAQGNYIERGQDLDVVTWILCPTSYLQGMPFNLSSIRARFRRDLMTIDNVKTFAGLFSIPRRTVLLYLLTMAI